MELFGVCRFADIVQISYFDGKGKMSACADELREVDVQNTG